MVASSKRILMTQVGAPATIEYGGTFFTPMDLAPITAPLNAYGSLPEYRARVGGYPIRSMFTTEKDLRTVGDGAVRPPCDGLDQLGAEVRSHGTGLGFLAGTKELQPRYLDPEELFKMGDIRLVVVGKLVAQLNGQVGPLVRFGIPLIE